MTEPPFNTCGGGESCNVAERERGGPLTEHEFGRKEGVHEADGDARNLDWCATRVGYFDVQNVAFGIGRQPSPNAHGQLCPRKQRERDVYRRYTIGQYIGLPLTPTLDCRTSVRDCTSVGTVGLHCGSPPLRWELRVENKRV